VAGSQLQGTGDSGQLVTVLTSIAPQVICLAVVGRLAAALLANDPWAWPANPLPAARRPGGVSLRCRRRP
jgi:hypothetical protein